jgi:hypothetical protein
MDAAARTGAGLPQWQEAVSQQSSPAALPAKALDPIPIEHLQAHGAQWLHDAIVAGHLERVRELVSGAGRGLLFAPLGPFAQTCDEIALYADEPAIREFLEARIGEAAHAGFAPVGVNMETRFRGGPQTEASGKIDPRMTLFYAKDSRIVSRAASIASLATMGPGLAPRYPTGLLVLGSGLPAFPTNEMVDQARDGGIALGVLGDGCAALSLADIEALPANAHSFAVVQCHCRYDKARNVFYVCLGTHRGQEVRIEDLVAALLRKGCTDITLFGCEIKEGVDVLREKLDPLLLRHAGFVSVRGVGSAQPTLVAMNMMDIRLCIEDRAMANRGQAAQLLESLTANSIAGLTYNAFAGEDGETVTTHRKAPTREAVEEAISYGAAGNTRHLQGLLLVKAAHQEDREKLQAMLATPGVDVNFCVEGASALVVALARGWAEGAALLRAAGAAGMQPS